MTEDKILKILDKANTQLKSANTGIIIYKPTNSNRLSLRGTLPPKPGSKKQKPHQQTIPLGINCNAAGIKKAKLEAQKLGAASILRQRSSTPTVSIIDRYCKAYNDIFPSS